MADKQTKDNLMAKIDSLRTQLSQKQDAHTNNIEYDYLQRDISNLRKEQKEFEDSQKEKYEELDDNYDELDKRIYKVEESIKELNNSTKQNREHFQKFIDYFICSVIGCLASYWVSKIMR